MPQAFEEWLGRQQERTDWATPGPLRRLAALLDHEAPPWRKDELPPLAHWLYHLDEVRQSELGTDGHARNGGFIPPIPLSRRMWAGSRVHFLQGVPIGAQMVRQSTLTKIVTKRGGSGEFTLVTIRHHILCDGTLAIEEEQDIAYLDAKARPRKRPGSEMPNAQATRRLPATPELLFRFSALTFNAHRIHYDRDYARDEEHHPGLVVHGPLLAMLLMDHYLRHHPARRVAGFTFRADAPVFEREPFDLSLSPTPAGAQLCVTGADGDVKMTALLEAAQEIRPIAWSDPAWVLESQLLGRRAKS
jgi:3-methylfumaryl-CoA hydratase